jgi:hypothetical protein
VAGQMQRIVHKQVGEELLEALRQSQLCLDSMITIYGLVSRNFTEQPNDIDPMTIQIGLQGQALAVFVLSNWLDALGTILGQPYRDRAAEVRRVTAQSMEDLGIVIPLPNPL